MLFLPIAGLMAVKTRLAAHHDPHYHRLARVMQAILSDLPLRNFHVLPFNIDHAMTSGNFMRVLSRDTGDDRVAVKDDVKLLAQMVCESITHILTEDSNTLVKYLGRLRDQGQASAQAIVLAEGFDAAWFNGGQKHLLDE